ncbi:MAG: acyl-CoA dehydrogenase family protein [Selenomonadales bacterium]|nr:acyl-CoA dehydrogenase family protein [Selenomonadales bacterium]
MLPQLHRQPWMDSDIETFRDQVRRYIAAEMAPHLPVWREQGYIPREVWRPFGEMGFMLPELPEEYGGAGASLAYQLVVQEQDRRTTQHLRKDPLTWLRRLMLACCMTPGRQHGSNDKGSKWLTM